MHRNKLDLYWLVQAMSIKCDETRLFEVKEIHKLSSINDGQRQPCIYESICMFLIHLTF